MTVSNSRNTDKTDLGYRMDYSPMGQTMTWPQMNVPSDSVSNPFKCLKLSVQTLYLKDRKATCKVVTSLKTCTTRAFVCFVETNM